MTHARVTADSKIIRSYNSFPKLLVHIMFDELNNFLSFVVKSTFRLILNFLLTAKKLKHKKQLLLQFIE